MPRLSHDQHRQAIRKALVLGLDVEASDPNLYDVVSPITEAQVDWIASWLASEGIGKVS